MLISLALKNWRVFKDEAVFSMRASRERFASEKSAKLPARYGGAKILPVAAIYGANASGKTSVIEALSFLRGLVVGGMQVNQAIPVVPFRLDHDSINEPTDIKVEFLVDSLIYRYEVSLTRSHVAGESLCIERSRGENQLLFARDEKGVLLDGKTNTERNRLIAENTRPNQLFLHNAVSQNSIEFLPAFNWFAKTLEVIGVDSQYEQYSKMLLRQDFLDFVNRKLRRYNTGIEGIVPVPLQKDSIPIPSDILDQIIATAPAEADATWQLRFSSSNSRGPEIYIINVKPGAELEVSKVKLQHKMADGSLVTFEMADESKGTQRLIELLPLFFDMAKAEAAEENSSKVYLVDELDRSYHSALTADLVQEYLAECDENTRNQLIFTTHDLILMDKETLRRDELWFCRKDDDGKSELICLGNQKGVRTDSDILKNYLDGKIGGCPRFRDE